MCMVTFLQYKYAEDPDIDPDIIQAFETYTKIHEDKSVKTSLLRYTETKHNA